MKRERQILLLVVGLCLLVPMALASVGNLHQDDFFANLEGDNQLTGGGGTGWGGGQWIYYDQTDWWNQWFYDDPPTWDRWKHIEYLIDIFPQIFTPEWQVQVDVALNWSTMDYPPTGPAGDPPMPADEPFIQREVVFSENFFAPNQPIVIEGFYDILDFNPEWVSIDVRVYSWGIDRIEIEPGVFEEYTVALPVNIHGLIWHECIIPEPATLALLGLGAVVAAGRKRV